VTIGPREIALTEMERAGAFDEAERTFQMTEEAFRIFYDQTARPVWIYLARTTGDDRLADDLLQETFYRFLRSRSTFESDDHRRYYLFRIASNLVRDHRRRPRKDDARMNVATEGRAVDEAANVGDRAVQRIDLSRAMEQLKPRERSLLWLAYAQGFSHEEIAGLLGLKTASLKALLYRARQRLITLLGKPRGSGGRL
jgi:RNA polymerase sigma-70 factor (ECF subfamily)